MKKLIKFFGLLLVLMITMLVFYSCSNDDVDLDTYIIGKLLTQ